MSISHHSLTGLTSDEAEPSPLLALPRKFWALVPWMLEATIGLTLLTACYLDTCVGHVGYPF